MCVLSINQNVTLLLDAVNLEKDCHQLMDMVACNQESKECMIHHCIDCLSRSELEDYLNQGRFQEIFLGGCKLLCTE